MNGLNDETMSLQALQRTSSRGIHKKHDREGAIT
jgi:hypothetical protein